MKKTASLILALLALNTGSIYAELESLKLQDINSLKNLNNSKHSTPKTSKKTAPIKKDLVYKVVVKGNKNIADSLIYNEISIRSGSKVNPAIINRNVGNIRSLGIFKNVSYTTKKTSSGIIITFKVEENPLIKEIVFDGNTVITDKEFIATINSQKNDILNLISVRKDIKYIEGLYTEQGYTYAKVYNIKTPDKDGEPLVFKIAEGEIEEVVITGNKKTQTYVVEREMNLKKGMLLKDATLREDLRRIYNLNYFTGLEPNLIPGKKPYSYKLLIDLVDRPSNATISFGGGYSPLSGMSVYSDLYWDNVVGSGQTVMLRGQFGRATTYQLKYHNPWMWDKRKSLTVKTWLTEGQLGSLDPLHTNQVFFRNERRKGVEVAVGWPYSYEFRSSHKLKYESVAIQDKNKGYKITSYTLGLTYDTRDVWFNPSEGCNYIFSYEVGLPLDKDSLDFNRYFIGFRQFFKTFDKQTIALRIDGDYLRSPMLSDEDIFYSQMYIVGGSSTVRGYDDQSPFAYGNKRVVSSLEYRLLFNDTFQGIIFVDAGNATTGDIYDLSKYKVGKGIGLRFLIPGLGPLRLDFGLDELGVSRLHFNIGHTF